jgi:DNA-binding response OmpR family regulator
MITANEGSRHKAYAQMLGVDDYLRKPFAMDVLLESVRKAFAENEGAGAGPLRRKAAVRKKGPE